MALSELQNKYSDIVKDFNEYLHESKTFKSVWEIRSFVNESFYQWNHRVVFDTVSKKLVTLPRTSDNDYQIWKIRKVVRWVRNMITKNDPRWHPSSSRTQRIVEDEKKVANAILQSVYKEDHLKDKIKDLLTHSLTKTLWWAFIWYSNQKKDVDVFVEDPFNIYTSPDWRLEWPVFVWKYIIRTIKKSLNDIKYSSLYKDSEFADDLKQIQADPRMAESDYKNNILEQDYQIPLDENWSAIVHELYIMHDPNFKDDDDDDNTKEEFKEITDWTSPEEDQMQHDDWKRVRIITKVGDIVIRDEITEYTNFPFIAYQPERDKWLLYNSAWIEPLIPLNKALNEWYSNRADWLEKFAKGRFAVQKWSKFTVIKWRNWQVIEYTGTKPTMMETWNLPQEVNIHMNETERYMEDIWWIHSESTGRLSWAELSWVAIAQLQASDLNNVSEPVDNLKTFLEELAYRILEIWSKFYNLREIESEEWKFMILWSEVKSKIEKQVGQKIWKNVIEIKPIRNIEVEIIPWSAFSDIQARQDIIELKWLWVAIPDRLILDTYKLGNTQMLLDEFETQEAERQAQEDWEEWLEAKQAELENQKLVEWANIVAQEPENHEVHLAIHWAMLKSLWNSPQAQLLIQHMSQHQAMFDPNWEQSTYKPQQANQNLQNNQ